MFKRSSVDAVTVLEAPVSQSFARRARVVFFAVAAGGGVLAATVLAAVLHPAQAVVLGVLAGVAAGFVAAVLVRVWPVLRVLWWWTGEIAAALLLLEGSAWLARATTPWVSIAVVLLATGLGCGIGPVRRFVVAWFWCAVVRHRLRLSFAEVIRSANRVRPASLPLVLIARPTPAGERVWLWLRPGLSLDELEGRTDRLAVACWASEVRLSRASTRYAALLRVDVARRDPLTGLVDSPLVNLLPGWLDSPAPVSPGMPPAGLDLADVPEEPPEPPRNPRRGQDR
jgi:hypothetical protein